MYCNSFILEKCKTILCQTIELKKELRALIESEEDIAVLEALLILLKHQNKDAVLKQKLSARAKLSNQQIKNGEFLSRKDMEQN